MRSISVYFAAEKHLRELVLRPQPVFRIFAEPTTTAPQANSLGGSPCRVRWSSFLPVLTYPGRRRGLGGGLHTDISVQACH